MPESFEGKVESNKEMKLKFEDRMRELNFAEVSHASIEIVNEGTGKQMLLLAPGPGGMRLSDQPLEEWGSESESGAYDDFLAKKAFYDDLLAKAKGI